MSSYNSKIYVGRLQSSTHVKSSHTDACSGLVEIILEYTA